MRNILPSNLVIKLWHNFRRYGLKATIGKLLTFARRKVYLDNTRVWYELPLGADRPRVSRLSGLSLIQASIRDLPLLDKLPTIDQYEATRRMEAGHDLWLALKGRQPVFACWVFHGSVVVIAARQGHIALPPEFVAFEDSVASLAYQGRAIGLAVWPMIADRLEQSRAKTILTQVEKDNVTARRAFSKSGFHEIATVHLRRIGPCRRLTIRAGNGATATWLAEQLAH